MTKAEELKNISTRLAEIADEVEKESADVPALDEESKKLEERATQLRAEIAKEDIKRRATPDSLFKPVVAKRGETKAEDSCHYTDTIEYRNAFMRFVQTGEKADILKRFDENTLLAETSGVVIPHAITNQIIEKMQSYGQIWSRITKTNYPAGLTVPTSDFGDDAEWVWDSENGSSEGKTAAGKKKSAGSISFGIFKCQVKVPISLEASVASLPIFEAKIVENNAIKIVKAIEKAVIAGSGAGQPKGIIAETTPAGQSVAVKTDKLGSYQTYADILGKVPMAYQNSVEWCFNKADYMTYIQGMVDANGQPVARTNYGLNGAIDGAVFLGRKVVLVEDYGLNAFNTTTNNAVIGFLFNFADYWFNSNLAVTYKKYTDDNLDMIYHKSTLLGDGKVVAKYSLVKILKDTAV